MAWRRKTFGQRVRGLGGVRRSHRLATNHSNVERMTMSINTTSICGRPTDTLQSLFTCNASRIGWSISFFMVNNYTRGFPIAEMAIVLNSSSNKFPFIRLWYIVIITYYDDLYSNYNKYHINYIITY